MSKSMKPKLRTPNSLPAHSAWAREGDQQFYRSLIRQGRHYEALYFLAFLESEYGCNPALMPDTATNAKAAYTSVDRSRRDVMNTSKITSIDAPVSNHTSKLASQADNTLLAKRSKVHPDLCSKSNVNYQENAVIGILDHALTSSNRRVNVTSPKIIPLKQKPRL